MMMVTRIIFFFRISKAMKHSEALSNSASTGTAENCNRKTVLRIQSKFSNLIKVLNIQCWINYSRNLFYAIDLKMFLFHSVAVIVCFLICWTPYHIERILFVIVNMKKKLKKLHTLHETLHVMSGN